VIDATAKGSVARFINHSCAANCRAKVFSFDGKSKKLVIIALRDIEVGEEISYDYKFAQEEERLACHCKADGCTGRLN
jgi:histone-lysine N-methyltransferase SETD1